MMTRCYLPLIPSGKMCKNLAPFLQPAPGSFVGLADGPGDEVGLIALDQ